LKAAGAVVVDPIEIPKIRALLAKRATDPDITEASTERWLARNPDSPYKTRADVFQSPDYSKVFPSKLGNFAPAKPGAKEKYYEFLEAREELMTEVMKVMADNRLDAIFMKSVEDQPPLISVATRPYSEPTLIKLAYAYERATHHRVPPKSTPALAGQRSN